MRGVLSQVYFQNNCNGILPEQLCLLLLADQGAKVNWGLLVDENFRIQLRGHRQRADYSSPIGPFLTSYIANYLTFYRRHNRGPLMGTFLDVQRDLTAAQNATQRCPAPANALGVQGQPRKQGRHPQWGHAPPSLQHRVLL